MKLVINGKNKKRVKDVTELFTEGLMHNKLDFSVGRDNDGAVITIEPQRPSFISIKINADNSESVIRNFDNVPIDVKILLRIIHSRRIDWLK